MPWYVALASLVAAGFVGAVAYSVLSALLLDDDET